MARYEHLPIFRDAYDLALHLEKIVRNFSRYHKYSLGSELRQGSHKVLQLITGANNSVSERAFFLEELRLELAGLKLTARLCHDSGGFASTRAYLYVAERLTVLARQNEGWLRQTIKSQKAGRRSRAETSAGRGQV